MKDLSHIFPYDDNRQEKLKARKAFLNWNHLVKKITKSDEYGDKADEAYELNRDNNL